MRSVVIVGFAVAACTTQGEAARAVRSRNAPDPEAGFVVTAVANDSATLTVVPDQEAVINFLNTELDPQELLAEGFGALAPILTKALKGETIGADEFLDAAAGIGIAALGMVNPLLGVFASFLWGFVGGGSGSELVPLEERIMEQVGLLMREAEYNKRVQQVKGAIAGVMDNVEDCCDPEKGTPREDMKGFSESMVDQMSIVFGDCDKTAFTEPNAECKEWRFGTEALEYAILYAQAHLHIIGEIIRLSKTGAGAKWGADLLLKYGNKYAKYLSKHYNGLFWYRTDAQRFTLQTRKFVSASGSTQRYAVSSNGLDDYLGVSYARGSDGCLMKGYKRSCTKGSNCDSMFNSWNMKFQKCLKKHVGVVSTQLRDRMRPAVAKLCDLFPGEGCIVRA